jgi:Type IV pilin-like G and H, putative
MSLSPESKQKLLPGDKLSKFIIVGAILSPLLFVLQQTYVFLADDSTAQKSSEERKVKYNIVAVNRFQSFMTLRKNSSFAKTFDEIAGDKTLGWNMSNPKSFEYKLDVRSKDLAIIGAKPSGQNLHSHNGATLKYKNIKGLFATKSIVCKSEAAGADGTDPINAPVADSSDKLRCAPGWIVVDETQSEPAKQQAKPARKVD